MGEASGDTAARAGAGGGEGSSEWGSQEGSGGQAPWSHFRGAGGGGGGVDGAGLGAWWCGESLAVLRANGSKGRGLLEAPGWAAGDDGVQRLRAGRWAAELVWPGENVCVLNLETGALQLYLPLPSPYKPTPPPLRTNRTRLPSPVQTD